MHLTLHLTTDCNLRCSYCYSPPEPGAGMSRATAEQALAFAAGLGGRGSGIVFFGGEPLLQSELLVHTVARARELSRAGAPPFHFKLTTNGLALDDAMLRFAAAEDIHVALSIDGTREAHDTHRRTLEGGPSYERVVERLGALLRVRPYSTTISVVSPDTVHCLADSVTALVELGCCYLVVSLDYAARWRDPDFVTLERELERLAGRYLEWTRAGRKFYLSPFEVMIASHVASPDCRRDRCELGERQLSVDSEGWLYPCVQFTRAGPRSEWCVGHVARGIDTAALGRIRAAAAREREPCTSCAIAARCNHSCGCLNWQTTGTIHAVSPVLCRYEQLLLPIADRVAETLFREQSPLFLHKHYNRAYPLLSLLEDQLPLEEGRTDARDR